MSADAQVKLSESTRRLVRYGAAVNDCTMGAFVDVAVAEFILNHADEIEAGFAYARSALQTGDAERRPPISSPGGAHSGDNE